MKPAEIVIRSIRSKRINELEEVCKPVIEYLKNNYDMMHCTVVINGSQIRLVRDEIGIPVK